MKARTYLLSVFLFLFACQQEDFGGMKNGSISVLKSMNADSSFVDLVLAKKVALKSVEHSSRSTSLSIGDVFTVNDGSGIPALYVINQENDQGFVIVSATKNYHPILAWSDKGYFNPDLSSEAVAFYVSCFCYDVNCLRYAPFDSICQYRQEWYNYEKNKVMPVGVSSRSIPADVQYYMENSVIQWQNEGYEVEPIANNGFNLPTSVYENALYMAEMYMREDYMETSFILKKEEVTTMSVPKLLITEWGQNPPYNDEIINYYGRFYPVGCVAVALAQIMKYHEKPQNYNWDAMPPIADYFSYNYVDVSELMFDIGRGVNMNYKESGSEAYAVDAVDYLRSIGYNNTVLVSHNANSVKSQLMNGHPVYMRGGRYNDMNELSGHAWVCDGYVENNGRTAYYLMALDPYTLNYCSRELMYENEWRNESFHMNWGYDGEANGWFRDTNISFSYENNTLNYQIGRQDIINIY